MQLKSDALNEAVAWPCADRRIPVVLASQLMAAELYQEGFGYFAARSDSTPTDAQRRGRGTPRNPAASTRSALPARPSPPASHRRRR
jgi:hypothetical protein